MAPRHRLLERQVRRLLPEGLAESIALAPLFDAIATAYEEAEERYSLLERSMELSSEELSKRNAEQRAILQAFPDDVLVVDRSGLIIDVKSERGIERRELMGAQLHELFAFSDTSSLQAHLAAPQADDFWQTDAKSLPEAESAQYELRGIGLDEDRHLVIVRDVTVQRRFERDLVEARDEAESAAEAKDEFLATMSHELRTPLNGVIGMAGLLKETGLTREQREFVDIIQSSGVGLLTLLRDVLDFARLESGEVVLEPVAFDPNTLAIAALRTFADAAHGRDVELIPDLDPELPRQLVGDAERIRQVLVNLIGNAVKFTEAGHVSLRVEAIVEAGDSDRNQLRFEVRDSGIGIAPEALDKLFAAFTQADGSTTRRHGGTGLGLAIARRVVSVLGGELHCESSQGEGSCFSFSVPVRTHTQAKFLPKTPSRLKGWHVLLVDADEEHRGALTRLMRNMETQVSTAQDLESARQLLLKEDAKHPIRLVLVNMKSEACRDFGALGELCGGRQRGTTPVIALAPVNEKRTSAQAKRAGVSALLRKPVAPLDLVAAIASLAASSGAKPQVQSDVARDREAAAGLRGARILLVEDNLVNQRVASLMLGALGCEVQLANNGREAIEMARDSSFDVILMDCQMPEVDGYEATRSLRASGYERPIVALTANALSGDRERCLEAGMNEYLAKPVRRPLLSDMLQKMLSEAS